MVDSGLDRPVVIVGGGVAGLAAANALAARECRTVVVEKARAAGEIDRGDVIHHSSLAFFRHWRIAEVFDQFVPLTVGHYRIVNHRGDELFRCDLEHDLQPPAPFRILRHPDIQRALEAAAVQSGYVTVSRNTVCQDLITREGRVVGVVTNKGQIEASLTVIANGVSSKLRDRYFKGRSYFEYPVAFLNLRCRRVEAFADAGYYVLGSEGVMVLAPLPQGEMRLGVQYAQAAHENNVSVRNVREIVRRRLSVFPIDDLEVLEAHVYRISKSLSDSLWIPGAVLVGDAAHTTHPVGGQGMNLAFQDAEVLAEQLAEAGSQAKDGSPLDQINRACARYSHLRRAALKRVLARTHVMGVMGSMQHPAWVGLRESLLRLANRSPFLKQQVLRRIVEVR